MMVDLARRNPTIVRLGAIMSCLVLLGASAPVQARDSGGVADFFSHAFGLDAPEPTYDAPPTQQMEPDRTLIVRPHHTRRPRMVAKAEVPKGPVGPVSIYEDRTLQRGDAVMTADGIRIFKGSDSMPYNAGDFVAVSSATSLSKPVEKALLAIDRVPRS